MGGWLDGWTACQPAQPKVWAKKKKLGFWAKTRFFIRKTKEIKEIPLIYKVLSGPTGWVAGWLAGWLATSPFGISGSFDC